MMLSLSLIIFSGCENQATEITEPETLEATPAQEISTQENENLTQEKQNDAIFNNEVSEIEINQETDQYIIDVVYPETNGFTKLNQYIEKTINDDIQNFKEEISNEEWYDQDIEDIDMRHGYYSRFEVIAFTPKLFSVKLYNSTYYGGAAHPMSYTDVINYDLINNKEFELSDLFIDGSDYITYLSEYCIDDLNFNMYQETDGMGYNDWIEEGASPDEVNFLAFNLAPEGILITFDPYQVAAYAAGPQEVLIPYSELQEILRDDLPLEFDHEDYMYN